MFSFFSAPGTTETQPPSVADAGLNGFYNGLDTLGTLGGTIGPRDDNQLVVSARGGSAVVSRWF